MLKGLKGRQDQLELRVPLDLVDFKELKVLKGV